MKFRQLISGAVASDGGTIACRILLDDGTVLDCGLDGRIPITKADRLIFLGAGYPTLPDARFLERNRGEEAAFIEALREFVDEQPQESVASMLLRAVLDR